MKDFLVVFSRFALFRLSKRRVATLLQTPSKLGNPLEFYFMYLSTRLVFLESVNCDTLLKDYWSFVSTTSILTLLGNGYSGIELLNDEGSSMTIVSLSTSSFISSSCCLANTWTHNLRRCGADAATYLSKNRRTRLFEISFTCSAICCSLRKL